MKMPPPSPPSAPFRSFPISKQLNLLCTFGRCRPVSPLKCRCVPRKIVCRSLLLCFTVWEEQPKQPKCRQRGRQAECTGRSAAPNARAYSCSPLFPLSLLSPLPHYYCPKLLHSSGSVGARLNKKRREREAKDSLLSRQRPSLFLSRESALLDRGRCSIGYI